MLKRSYYAAGSVWATATKRIPFGRNIYDDDWDCCIVLDSARADMFESVAPKYLSPDSTGRAWSRGSITTEWLTQTFREPYADEIEDTTFLSANPHSTTVFEDRHWLTNQRAVGFPYPSNPAVAPEDFDAFHELWQTHAPRDTFGAVPPDVMAEATIEVFQKTDGRVVSFWLQPHEPFIAPEAKMVGGDPTSPNVWRDLNQGHSNFEPEAVWQSYRANLEYALEHVRIVLDAIDATVLVTADHGNLFGDLGRYGHPFGMLHPAVRRVPWWRCSGRASSDRTPQGIVDKSASSNVDREEQLAALGYR